MKRYFYVEDGQAYVALGIHEKPKKTDDKYYSSDGDFMQAWFRTDVADWENEFSHAKKVCLENAVIDWDAIKAGYLKSAHRKHEDVRVVSKFIEYLKENIDSFIKEQ